MFCFPFSFKSITDCFFGVTPSEISDVRLSCSFLLLKLEFLSSFYSSTFSNYTPPSSSELVSIFDND